jgi:Protein of unknown function (DUF3995)
MTAVTEDWAAYAAAAWAFAFAAVSFYWAAGGEVALDTLAVEIERDARARDSATVALTWATGAVKVLGGLVALALVRPWGASIPRRLLLVLAMGAGAGLTLYGAAGLVEKILMKTGAIDVSASFGSDRVIWYLLLWDPYWLLGGILFLLAALRFRRAGAARTP